MRRTTPSYLVSSIIELLPSCFADTTEASQYQAAFGKWIDWQYQTVPQTSANGQAQTMRSGRALGGSTAINGMAWSKPHDFQIDAMEQLGNSGLNWNSLQRYVSRIRAARLKR